MTQARGRYKMVAEIGSAMAVVLSLIFVGLEVRETAEQTALNTESLQVAAYQDLIAQISEFNRLLIEADVAALYTRLGDSEGDWAELSTVDQRRGFSLLFLLFRHADMAFYQFERGMLPEARFESALQPLLGNIDRPLYRAFWADNPSRTSFRAFSATSTGESRMACRHT